MNGVVRLRGAVLIGGESRRMGCAKALLEYGGRSFAARVAEALRAVAESVVVVGRGQVPRDCIIDGCVEDAAEVDGPLAGVLGALRADGGAAWVIAACDQPLMAAAGMKWLVGWRGAGVRVVMPMRADGRVEPLPAVYEAGARQVVESLVAGGCLAPRELAGRAGVVSPVIPSELEACWRNVNTPEELAELRS